MITLYTIGQRNNAYKKQIEEYLKRMHDVQLLDIKQESRLPEKIILFSEEGKQYTSKEFADFIKKKDDKELFFAIGPAEGFSEKIRSKQTEKISLSSMTLPHELASLLAVEQIYRAKTIISGKPYHKE